MQSLIDFLVHYKHWFVFLLLEAVSLLGLFSYDGYQKHVYFTTANGIVGSVYSAVSSVMSYLHLQTVNQELEEDNERMRRQIVVLREKLRIAEADSQRVNGLPIRYSLVSAQVVNATLHRSNNLITINRGSADGIQPEMGVVCSRGVVGVVHLVSPHYAIVMPLLNEHCKISCRLRKTEYFGTLEWQRGRSDVTWVTGIPRHAKVRKNEVVETNGYSDIFPPGIPIGYVMKTGDSADGMFYLLKVGLFTPFQTLREVSVITNYTQPERRELEERADSLNTN
ncbi:MAG: rod shape-determining protein MreC [Bacteroidaceae bacterium]|nr:rod shape-determining protein MreC [Bacteroidaceae bacterium]